MDRFHADLFFVIARYLTRVQQNIQSAGSDDEQKVKAGYKEGGAAHRNLTGIKNASVKIGLTISAKAVDHILETRPPAEEVKELLAHLQRTIQWEMEDKLFMYIPAERAARYDQKELLGQVVNSKFPTTQYDATEAGNCYACGRSTAVVLHLMRIMEVGLQQLGTKLGVSLTQNKNWQNTLDEVNKQIKTLPAKHANTITLSQAAAYMP